jgi:phenylalanyl-tRNA synthetase beta chain
MKVSYNWLKEYLDFDYSPEELSEILTNTGLEVSGTERWEAIKGGLEGLVIGEVITCDPLPDSDHLSKTTVNLGDGKLTPIVCGAPNVAAGQKVVVATVGTTLYDGDKEINIKKSKIRGEISEGMICGESEIGVGNDTSGIIVLEEDCKPGTKAADYFEVEKDTIFDIDLTPNRTDGMSHIGVVRDIRAVMMLHNLRERGQEEYNFKIPSVENFKTDNTSLTIKVDIKDPEACFRYTGLTLSGIEVKESPEWLKNRLISIGLTPVNNVVDITNFVLYETGQPLHAFDADKIKDRKIIVQKLFAGTEFKTLDGKIRKLSEDDLMINDIDDPLCIGGILGGLDSGVSAKTTNIFLESAWFDPVHIRRSSKFHDIHTDASFRFERGVDPNMTLYALKRAAMLIKELAGGKITSRIQDVSKKKIIPKRVLLIWKHIERLVGQSIPKKEVKIILEALEFKVADENKNSILVEVPGYRIDVLREADIIEEILRIYGYNNIDKPDQIRISLNPTPKPDLERVQNIISDYLSSNGFNEIMNNSLTKGEYYENCKDFDAGKSVKILNPLSRDLNVMRQSMLFGCLETAIYNINHKALDLKIYEFGKIYHYFADSENKYHERKQLAMLLSGKKNAESWNQQQFDTDFFHLKVFAENILKRLGININKLTTNETHQSCFQYGINYQIDNKHLLRIGAVNPNVSDVFGIEQNLFYAEFDWDRVLTLIPREDYSFTTIAKYPEVRRDLSLLVDNEISFDSILKVVIKTDKQLIKSVGLFDIYQGKNLPSGKKSYAIKIILQDKHKTLKDKQIDKIVKKVIFNLEKELNVTIR